MRRIELINELRKWDFRGREAFTIRDLMKITGASNADALTTTLYRESVAKEPVLKRAAQGVYVFALSNQPRTHTIEHIARALRRGHHSYVSLESALSEHGRISQIMVGRLTVMTTGRSGVFETEGFGTIEFTHTDRQFRDFMNGLADVGRPLRLASENLALEDLRRVRRNLQMVLPEDDEETFQHDV